MIEEIRCSDTIRATVLFDRARNSLTAHQISNRNDLKRVCDKLSRTAQTVDFKYGEMSEWLKEHAWKTTPATLTE